METATLDPFDAASDPGMPFLPAALDPARMRDLFVRRLPRLFGGTGGIRLLAIRVARHKKGRRALLAYDVAVEDSRVPAITLIGKMRAKGVDRSNYDRLVALRRAGFADGSDDGISIPEPLGIVPELGMWFQRKAPGVPATALLPGPEGIALAGRIAEAIRKVHLAGVSPRKRHAMADELAIVHERLEAVALQSPKWKNRIDSLLAACDRLGASVSEPEPCGIHRDFYADHILVDGGRLWLLDFDLFCEGDPGLDAGNFVAHLAEQGLRTQGDPDALADREEAFEERFLGLAGERHRACVRAYATLTLVRHISISRQIPERAPFTEPLLELCERRLEIILGPPSRRRSKT